MSVNISQDKVRFYPITATEFTVVAGAAAWIDTDVSACTGTNTNRLWVVTAGSAASQVAGARANGETISNESRVTNSGTFLSRVSATGYMDLRRDATNDFKYVFIGYFE